MRTVKPPGTRAWPSAASGELVDELSAAAWRRIQPDAARNKPAFVSWVALSTLLVATAVALGSPLPKEYRAVWVGKLFDLGHVPLFFLLAWAFLRTLGDRPATIAALGCLVAVVAELLQLWTGRSASVEDVARGLVGVLVGLLLLRQRSTVTFRRKLRALVVAGMFLAWPIWTCAPALLDAVSARRSFPVLADFRSRFETRRWVTRSAGLDRIYTSDCAGWRARIAFAPGPGVSGEAIQFPVVSDWRGYRSLLCEFSFDGAPLTILFSIRDGRKIAASQRRFDLQRRYPSGKHRLIVDLDSLSRGDDDYAPIDLAHVQSVHFCVVDALQPRTVLLHRLVLLNVRSDLLISREQTTLSRERKNDFDNL